MSQSHTYWWDKEADELEFATTSSAQMAQWIEAADTLGMFYSTHKSMFAVHEIHTKFPYLQLDPGGGHTFQTVYSMRIRLEGE